MRMILECAAMFVAALTISLAAHAASPVLFEDDFEQTLSSKFKPHWGWKASYNSSNPYGMMLGQGDIYERSTSHSFTGKYSLRLNFDGRNGWCNTCGSYSYDVIGNDPDNGLVFSTSINSLLSTPGGENRQVFNKDDRWARWSLSDLTNGSLARGLGRPVRNDLGGQEKFSKGDVLGVARICGIDGDVGKNIDRRSDCNLAINYLQGISASDFPAGGTLARRFYLYVPASTVLPNVGLKLGYTVFKRDGVAHNIIPVLSAQRGETLEVKTTSITGSYSFPKFKVERDTWYYFEEVYNRESSESASDGIYTLYFSEAKDPSSKPLLRYSGVRFGSLSEMSIIGNWQHTNDALGYLYIDNVVVSKRYIGPLNGDPQAAVVPPAAPVLTIN